MTSKTTYQGGCHCGRVRFRVRGDLGTASECNCSMCNKKGFIHLVVSPSDFEVIQGRDELATYQFNTGTAKHTFCKTCGIHPFYVPRSDPDKIDVNVRCLDDVDPSQIQTRFFDGKNWEQAIQGHLPWRDGP
jgi:hypothetical protein